MRKFTLTLVVATLLSPVNIFAQNAHVHAASAPLDSYWQQQVNYIINVKLDDVNHQLHGNINFTYINHSPVEITEIPVHLWANGYANSKTALAKQLKNLGKSKLNGSNSTDFGGIDSLEFTFWANTNAEEINHGKLFKWRYDATHVDICYVTLLTPLKTGDSVSIYTPFRIRIPDASVSRMGHIGQAYQITQWYPKPAVFDKNGWHAMPYLNQGEFYSEYGNYDVRITLPDNYTVGSTGDLQTESEIARLDYLASTSPVKPVFPKLKQESTKLYENLETKTPESSSKWKTLHYVQSQVHDFAWFADKTFIVNKGSVELPGSTRKVTTWSLFTPQNARLWQYSQEYLQDAIYYYSLWNGNYPYNQVTAVDGTISAGGGMEYPNVTVIGNSNTKSGLEVVIVHEVGHNWFYGILGSNERDNGWMDEGLNTLNEMRYMETKYPNNNYLKESMGLPKKLSLHLESFTHSDEGLYSVRMIQSLGVDQPICTHSAEFTSINYGIIMYQKTGLVFNMLRENLGDSLFDVCFRDYYNKWSFKHPQPEDLQNVFQQNSHRNLNYLFKDIIQTTKYIDYTIKSVKPASSGNTDGYLVKVKNVGQIECPVSVSIIDTNNKIVATSWTNLSSKTDLIERQKIIAFNLIFNRSKPKTELLSNNSVFIPTSLPPHQIQKFQIDVNNRIPELQSHNNVFYYHKLFPKHYPAKIEFLTGNHEPGKTNSFWVPVIGWNAADRFMLGVLWHNYGLPLKKNTALIMPMYSFKNNALRGIVQYTHHYYPKRTSFLSSIGLTGFLFGSNNDIINYKTVNYVRNDINIGNIFVSVNPFININLGNRNTKTNFRFSHSLLIKGTGQLINRNVYNQPLNGIVFDPKNPGTIVSNNINTNGIQIKYQAKKTLNKLTWRAAVSNEYLSQIVQFADSTTSGGYNNFFPASLEKTTSVFRNSITAQLNWRYYKTRTFQIRAFAGTIWGEKFATVDGSKIDGLERLGYSMTGALGERDYFAENLFLNRSGNSDLSQTFAQQRANDQGGMKSTTSLGLSTRTALTFNTYLTLPVGPKIFGLYYDMGVAESYKTQRKTFMHTAGIGIRFGEFVGIYIPVINSANIKSAFGNTPWNNQIRLNINLNLKDLLPY